MKKPYQKPRVYVETFELLEHIASCKANQDITTVTYRDGYACTYTDAGLTLFQPANLSCKNDYYDPDDTSSYNNFEDYIASFALGRGGCYNAFTDGNFFAS